MSFATSLKEYLLRPQWMVGVASSCYIISGWFIGIGRSIVGLGLALLGVALMAADYNLQQQKHLKQCGEAYQAGYAHAQRHSSSRR